MEIVWAHWNKDWPVVDVVESWPVVGGFQQILYGVLVVFWVFPGFVPSIMFVVTDQTFRWGLRWVYGKRRNRRRGEVLGWEGVLLTGPCLCPRFRGLRHRR